MITYLRGRLVHKDQDHTIIECNGVGYHVSISTQTYDMIADLELDSEIKVHTYFHVYAEGQRLIGFYDVSERVVFELLLGVSGISTQTALKIISAMPVQHIYDAILSDNAKAFRVAKGVGEKVSKMIVISLKNKIKDAEIQAHSISSVQASAGNTLSSKKEEAVKALEVLGMDRRQMYKQVDEILEADPDLSVSDVIKIALSR